jgi:tetratricopeptide (TPR) repeat protein
VTTGFLGYAHVLSGRVAEGLPLLQQGQKDAESSGLTLYHSRLTLWLGEAFMRVDQLEDALAQGERALRLTQERGERGLEAWARWLLGEVASRRETPDVEGTAGQYRQALALADDLALRPLAARCHDGLGKLYGRAGQRPEATAHLVTATTMYRTMSMSVWLEQAEAVLTALS